jgi:hypothetical protein
VSWAEVARLCGLDTIGAVDIGLRTGISGLQDEFSQQQFADKIDHLEAAHQIFPPAEGCFSDLLHDKVLQAIQTLGYEWVWIGDEFCTERKVHWIDDLKGPEAQATRGHCNLFTPDKELLWTTHWDSHFSFLCSSRRNLEAIHAANQFEGFYCSADTEVYWSVLS